MQGGRSSSCQVVLKELLCGITILLQPPVSPLRRWSEPPFKAWAEWQEMELKHYHPLLSLVWFLEVFQNWSTHKPHQKEISENRKQGTKTCESECVAVHGAEILQSHKHFAVSSSCSFLLLLCYFIHPFTWHVVVCSRRIGKMVWLGHTFHSKSQSQKSWHKSFSM